MGAGKTGYGRRVGFLIRPIRLVVIALLAFTDRLEIWYVYLAAVVFTIGGAMTMLLIEMGLIHPAIRNLD